MNKKIILGSLLVSTTLLGASASSLEAATSKLKKEQKIVTVSSSKAKLYKNSNLSKKDRKSVKKGTIYKVDGYRIINKKHYYRVYQEDKKGKIVYKGYLLNKDTKTVTSKKFKTKKIYVKKGSPLYKTLFLTQKSTEKKDKTEYTTKTYYTVNGKKYYSVSKGKKWVGYVSEKSLTKAPTKKPATPSKPKPEVKPETSKPVQPSKPVEQPKPEVKPEQKPSQDEDKKDPVKDETTRPSTPSGNENKNPGNTTGNKGESDKTPSTDKKDPVKDETTRPSTPSGNENKNPGNTTGNKGESDKTPSTDKKDPVKDENKQPSGNKDEGNKQPSRPVEQPKPSTPKPEQQPSKPAEENKVQSITTSPYVLKDPKALSKAIIDSEFGRGNAKDLARLFAGVAIPVLYYSTDGNTADNPGLEITWGWSRFDGNGRGDYQKTFELLQKYAKNVNSVSDEELKNAITRLIEDFQGMRVITTDLQQALNEVRNRQNQLKGYTTNNTISELIKKAQDCIDNPTLDNWKNIIVTTKALKGEAQKLDKQIAEQNKYQSAVKNTTITTNRSILNSPQKLCRTILDARNGGDNAFNNLGAAQDLANLLYKVCFLVWEKSEASGVNPGLQMNSAWTAFEGNGNGHLYKAISLLQKYARDTNSVSAAELQYITSKLVDDLEGMKVITSDLEDVVNKIRLKEGSYSVDEVAKLVQKAQELMKDPNLKNWNEIIKTTEALKKLAK